MEKEAGKSFLLAVVIILNGNDEAICTLITAIVTATLAVAQ